MDPQPSASLHAPRNSDVDQAGRDRSQPPERRGCHVAQRRVRPDREHGGDEASFGGQAAVPDRIHPAMHGVQTTGVHPVRNGGVGETGAAELRGGHHAMLPLGELREAPIQRCSTFLPTI